ncbi:GPW/gp25 family protein [Vibrio fluvialis]|uniref:GPW/gp25 family protein n=1 Tax=Vibrio fluvialis TaxID=676 RepID=UPI001EEB1A8E|nr:GPW/gp25 family protein [Vibrio fluvialis]MCG6380301.1 GPW/gp25 family protein [Vibrio fluvialis]
MTYSLKFAASGRNTDLVSDIKQSLFMIVYTGKSERIYMPDYAADALEYVDKPQWEVQGLKVSIAEAVAKYEPRVRLEGIIVYQTDLPQGIIGIKLSCQILATGQSEVFDFTNA